MSNIQLIALREFKMRVRKRAFPISTAVMALVVIIGAFLPIITGLISGNSQTKLAIVNQTGSDTVAGTNFPTFFNTVLNTPLAGSGQTTGSTGTGSKKQQFSITYPANSDVKALQSEVRSGKLDGVLTVSRDSKGALSFSYFTQNGTTDSSTLSIRQAVTILNVDDQLAQAGVTPAQQAALATPPNVNITTTQSEKDKQSGRTDAEVAANSLLVFALVVTLFSTIMTYGSMVAQGVVEEKSSRIMEILINAATPRQLMFGKIFGIGLLGLLQFGILAVVAVISFMAESPVSQAVLGYNSGSLDFAGIGISIVLWFFLFFILAYCLYAGLYAAVGSLCSRIEDVQQAVAPLTYLLLIDYIAGIFGLQSVDAGWVAVLSYIPFFSPILMFMRIGIGTVSPLEIAISVLLLVASIILFGWLAARVYRSGVLMYGQKPNTRQLIRLMFSRSKNTPKTAQANSVS